MSATLLLSAADVERLLTPRVCIDAVEDAFRRLAQGGLPAPGILSLHSREGSFHVKAGVLEADRPYFAAKVNANFPRNHQRHGLPTIQGVVYLCDAGNGMPLAVMDSISVTALRTAAASAVAAKHLAARSCDTALICGCGAQALAQLRALLAVRRPKRLLACDEDRGKAIAFAQAASVELGIPVSATADLGRATAESRIVITCTTARRYFVTREMVRPGTFIAAVGADNEEKQEIDPQLLASAKVVTDLTEQAATIGDLHHAIGAGAMTKEDVHAELGEVVAGRKPGRVNGEEIIVFDSTGTGLQDVAAAVAVYRRAAEEGLARGFTLTQRRAA
jgi:ornithine cyclodeaminase/alanine dehydrogenase-like protein (mu-crystallin family)